MSRFTQGQIQHYLHKYNTVTEFHTERGQTASILTLINSITLGGSLMWN